ncbi:hypothetical protein DHEL01_v201048 [Diaporthe helianthi]|uniref:Uncharacterized protein n=1 Tax=Diaporthe helianthi TaxID=158607 RepID=A0A2P5IDH4_DIAHE|nr:hypothetical protein DHEL01_v201048 [Diaporthe helianthi]
MPIPIGKINTQFSQAPQYDMHGDQSALTSTTASSSSYGPGIWTPSSAQAPSSAYPLTLDMVSPCSDLSWFRMSYPSGPNVYPCASTTQTTPCDAQSFAPWSYESTSSDFQEHAVSQDDSQEEHSFSQDMNVQLGTEMNMDTMISVPEVGSNINVDYDDDIFKDLYDEVNHSIQDWAPQPLFATGPMVTHQEFCDGLEAVTTAATATANDHADAGRTSPPFFPEISMTEAEMASDGSVSPPSSTSPTPNGPAGQPPGSTISPKCPECGWSPDPKAGRRSLAKLMQAVEKHFKRNHRSKNHRCPACSQVFRNRPDNVKPHVRRSHPEVFRSVYPQRKKASAVAVAVATQEGSSSSTCERRAISLVEAPVGKPVATKGRGRYTRPKSAR